MYTDAGQLGLLDINHPAPRRTATDGQPASTHEVRDEQAKTLPNEHSLGAAVDQGPLRALTGALRDSQRTDVIDLVEGPGVERPAVDLERWAPAVGRVGEDVVDQEQAIGLNVWDPTLIVAMGGLVAVAAVDEQQRQGGRPYRGRVATRRPAPRLGSSLAVLVASVCRRAQSGDLREPLG